LSPLSRNAITLACFSLVAVLFSWPLVLEPDGLLISRQFDAYSMLWLINVAPSVDADLSSPLTAWPVGEGLLLADSDLLLACSWLLSRVLDPVLLASAMTIGGPTLSAWAAERFAARGLGARWPWSLLAGLAYGFSGSVATSLLEGHVYVLMNPWLPLLAWSWMRATEARGRPIHGLAAGLFWSLCLLTSAYQGICATLLVLLWLGRAAWRGLPGRRPLLAAAAVALPVGLAYLLLVPQAGSRGLPSAEAFSALNIMKNGSASLLDLVAWLPSDDLQRHSMTPTLGFTSFSLALFAPLLLPPRGRWRACLALGVVAVLLSLGPSLRLNKDIVGLPWLLYPLGLSPLGTWFRFPLRLLWLAHLGLGAVAALSASRLAHKRPAVGVSLVLLVLADCLLLSGVPLRTIQEPTSVPSAYRSLPARGALLELLPEFLGSSGDRGQAFINATCNYQRLHHRPLLNNCLQPLPLMPENPQAPVRRWLWNELLGSDAGGDVAATLAALDVSAVALHPDLFPRGTRERLRQGLEQALGPPAHESRDGGEYVLLFLVRSVADGDPIHAYQALREEGW